MIQYWLTRQHLSLKKDYLTACAEDHQAFDTDHFRAGLLICKTLHIFRSSPERLTQQTTLHNISDPWEPAGWDLAWPEAFREVHASHLNWYDHSINYYAVYHCSIYLMCFKWLLKVDESRRKCNHRTYFLDSRWPRANWSEAWPWWTNRTQYDWIHGQQSSIRERMLCDLCEVSEL